MKPNEKLSRMLHILVHIHLHQGAATSETIAQMLGTNAVVVRRMMANLRNLGYVQSHNGRGGGWQLQRDPATLSVLDIYRALDEPGLLAMGLSHDHPHCPVEQSIRCLLEPALKTAEQRILEQYAGITLLDIAEQASR